MAELGVNRIDLPYEEDFDALYSREMQMRYKRDGYTWVASINRTDGHVEEWIYCEDKELLAARVADDRC